MKLTTGLRPTLIKQVVPQRENIDLSQGNWGATLPLPTASIRHMEVWILRFEEVVIADDGSWVRGDIVQTLLSPTQPKIEQKGANLRVSNEDMHLEERIAYERRKYDIPDDAAQRIDVDDHYQETTYRWIWWEVTM